jgi:transcriptional regulator with XRE-family HTH domain
MRFDHHKLRKLRLSRGYSLGQFARLLSVRTGLKVSRAAISLWERGKAKPSLASLIALCVFYGFNPGYFFADQEDRQSV